MKEIVMDVGVKHTQTITKETAVAWTYVKYSVRYLTWYNPNHDLFLNLTK